MAKSEKDIFIVNCGAQTPIEETAIYTASAARAEIYRVAVCPRFEDDDLNPLLLGEARYLDKNLPILDRFSTMGIHAIKEVMEPLYERGEKSIKIPIYIGLPEKRPGLPEHVAEHLKSSLINTLTRNQGIDFELTTMFDGHSSPAFILDQIKELFESDSSSLAVWGGVESYLDETRLSWLEEKNYLMCTEKTGMIPGEAAGFCLLATNEAIEKYHLTKLAKIHSWGTAYEENEFLSGKNNLGVGLSTAIMDAVDDFIPDEKIDQIYTTLNGIPYYSDEFGYALLKCGQYVKNTNHIQSFSHFWGDIGAASLPVFFSIATYEDNQKEAPGPYSLMLSSSLGQSRAAIIFELLQQS